jgi:hypothetical protein
VTVTEPGPTVTASSQTVTPSPDSTGRERQWGPGRVVGGYIDFDPVPPNIALKSHIGTCRPTPHGTVIRRLAPAMTPQSRFGVDRQN